MSTKSVAVSNTDLRSRKRNKTLSTIYAYRYLYFMAIPIALFYLIFAYVPMYGLTLAFKTFQPGGIWKLLFGGKFVGLKFFEEVMTDPLFWRAFKNTLIISVMKLVVQFPVTIIVVLLLNELRLPRFKKLTQTIMYLPHFFSWVVIGGIVVQLLSTTGGVVTEVIKLFNGGETVSLLTSNKAFRWILVWSTVFKNTGYSTIIYLAAIAGIPAELYEAASVDGASRFRKCWSITLPSLLPTIMTMLLINISHMINGDFDQVYMMYNSAVYESGDIIPTYLFRVGLSSGKFSMSTAMGLFNSIISVFLLLTTNALSKKLTGSGIY